MTHEEMMTALTELLPWVHNERFIVNPDEATKFIRYEEALQNALVSLEQEKQL